MIKSSADLDVNRSYTYADYLTWQFDEYVELIKGKIFTMSPAPSRKHQNEEIAVYQLNEYSEYSLVGLFSDEDSVPSGIFPGLEVNVAEIFKD